MRKTVLVVEDEFLIALDLELLLEQADFETSEGAKRHAPPSRASSRGRRPPR